jgi:hypothetical protein
MDNKINTYKLSLMGYIYIKKLHIQIIRVKIKKKEYKF